MAAEKPSNSIKTWAEDDRPREKLQAHGRRILTDAELVAILLGSGAGDKSAVELGKEILRAAGNDLYELGKKDIDWLCQFKGMGPAKSIGLIAALELGRRRKETEIEEKPRVSTSRSVYNYLLPKMESLEHEEFHLICLNPKNLILHWERIGQGGINSTVADVRQILRIALTKKATAIIIAHNHPSGNPRPSPADKLLTKKIQASAEVMDIKLFDHVIVADRSYFSFADERLLE